MSSIFNKGKTFVGGFQCLAEPFGQLFPFSAPGTSRHRSTGIIFFFCVAEVGA
jgi:hypothetical protein